MADEALAAVSAIEGAQGVLAMFHAAVAITSYMCPLDATIDTVLTMSENGGFDYIIVGAGTAGSVLARRLTECPDVNVLVLEAGGCPPLEAVCPGYFTLQPETAFDYNYTAVDDGFSCQNLQGESTGVTIGKMLGGSSSIHHMLHIVGDKKDYYDWCKATDNSTWAYHNILPYIRKLENLTDPEILAEYGSFHGTSGPMKTKRQRSPQNDVIMAGFEEMGVRIKIDTNNDEALGVTEPLLDIGDYLKQSGLESYIRPVKDRPNLYIMTGATVSKVLFSEDNAATGVEFTFNDSTYTVNGNEIIVSAGSIKTPQLLMLSGVGDPEQLSSVGITPLVENVHVGQYLQDHTAACMLLGLEQDSSVVPPQNPFEFPVPMTAAYVALDSNQDFADYQAINLIFPHDSPGLLQLCLKAFKYKVEICQKMYEANVGRKVVYIVPNILRTESRGNILLNNTDINTQPIINLNLLNNPSDLTNLARYLAHFSQILNTTSFRNIGAEFIDVGVCNEFTYGTEEFWLCYAREMSASMWHFAGSCVLNRCLDNSFRVIGTSNLRVVDASAMPLVTRGNILTGVVVLSEKAADIIKIEDGLTCSSE